MGTAAKTIAAGAGEPSDAVLATKVAAALAWDLWVPEQRLRVTVASGRVTLEGELDSSTQREAAVSDALAVAGVREVRSRLTIRSTPSRADVEARILGALGTTQLPPTMRVETFPGVVLLRGRIGTRAQRSAARRAAGSLPGVCEVLEYLDLERGYAPPAAAARSRLRQHAGGTPDYFPLNDP